MSTNGLELGALVVHVKKPEWGPGKIVKLEPGLVHVVWRNPAESTKEAFLMPDAFVRLAPEQHDEILDHLPALVEKGGKMLLPRTRITFDAAIQSFRHYFPKGFEDEDYIGNLKDGERFAKWEAHLKLDQLVGHRRLRKKMSTETSLIVKETERIISSLFMLHVNEFEAFKDALADEQAAILFLTKLADLLEAEIVTKEVFEPYAEAVCNLPAERGPVAKWTVATIIPFLAKPDRHMFMKPEVTQEAAQTLGFELNYTARPNWLTYSSLLRMTNMIRDRLPQDMKPRDMIDIQSFIYVVGRYGK